ncbi:sodium-dependent glucose transporter 1B-like [Lineus longissimus]|uniref:sodium-dependent glucose transporter 1B-like n=1 Tax=Lineus longissimus TaxID=88925 RepID=UPI00315CB0DF
MWSSLNSPVGKGLCKSTLMGGVDQNYSLLADQMREKTQHKKIQKWVRIFATAMTGSVYFSKGLMFSVPGPTLLSLQNIVDTSVDEITWIYGARGIGLIVGCFMLGFVVKDRWRSAMFGINFVVAGLSFGFSPWCRSLTSILVAFTVSGFGMGFVEAGGNYFIMDLWGESSPAILAAVIGCFIIGATVSPLIAIPFLPAEHFNRTNRAGTFSGAKHFNSTIIETNTTNGSNVDVAYGIEWDSRRNVHIETLYFIIMVIACVSGLCLACGSALVSHFGQDRGESSPHTKVENEQKKETETSIVPKGSSYIFIVCLMFLFIMVLIGLELNFYGMVAAYIVLGMNGTKQEGTLMVSYFWGIYAVFSTVGIVTSNFFTPSTLLLVNLALITVANIFLVSSAPTWVTLWVGTTVLSIGFGSTYAGVFIWSNFYLKLSHKVSAALVAGGQVGTCLVPIITGYFFAKDPFSLMKITMVCALICDVLFVLVEVVVYRYVRGTRPTSLGLRKLRETGYDNLDS